jgi:hypothetical protein
MCPYISQQFKLNTVNIKQWILHDSMEMWGPLRVKVSVGRVKFITFLLNKKWKSIYFILLLVLLEKIKKHLK